MRLMSAPAAKKPPMREATTRIRASATSSPWRSMSTSDSRSSIGPHHRTGREEVAAERAAEQRLDGPAGLEQRLEVDARLDAHLVQHRHEVLGGDVAGRAGRDRAAAELAEAGLEAVDALVEGGQRVGQ